MTFIVFSLSINPYSKKSKLPKIFFISFLLSQKYWNINRKPKPFYLINPNTLDGIFSSSFPFPSCLLRHPPRITRRWRGSHQRALGRVSWSAGINGDLHRRHQVMTATTDRRRTPPRLPPGTLRPSSSSLWHVRLRCYILVSQLARPTCSFFGGPQVLKNGLIQRLDIAVHPLQEIIRNT